MTDQTQEILELSALAPTREKAIIRTEANPDGTIYELAAPEDFGVAGLATMGKLFSEHDVLYEQAERTPAEDSRLETLLDDLTQRLIPDAPAAAIAALPALTKRMLAVRFFVSTGQATAPLLPKVLLPQDTAPAPASS